MHLLHSFFILQLKNVSGKNRGCGGIGDVYLLTQGEYTWYQLTMREKILQSQPPVWVGDTNKAYIDIK